MERKLAELPQFRVNRFQGFFCAPVARPTLSGIDSFSLGCWLSTSRRILRELAICHLLFAIPWLPVTLLPGRNGSAHPVRQAPTRARLDSCGELIVPARVP